MGAVLLGDLAQRLVERGARHDAARLGELRQHRAHGRGQRRIGRARLHLEQRGDVPIELALHPHAQALAHALLNLGGESAQPRIEHQIGREQPRPRP